MWYGAKIFFFFKVLFIYLFIYGCVGSSFLCEGFPQLRQAGATPHRGAQASHGSPSSRSSSGQIATCTEQEVKGADSPRDRKSTRLNSSH